MEKVKIDTEVRKLYQAARRVSQPPARHSLGTPPPAQDIANARKTLQHLSADIPTRDRHDGEECTMTVGQQMFSGKRAREEAARALVRDVYVPPRRLHAAPARPFQGL
jgi:hypothetical protein